MYCSIRQLSFFLSFSLVAWHLYTIGNMRWGIISPYPFVSNTIQQFSHLLHWIYIGLICSEGDAAQKGIYSLLAYHIADPAKKHTLFCYCTFAMERHEFGHLRMAIHSVNRTLWYFDYYGVFHSAWVLPLLDMGFVTHLPKWMWEFWQAML